MIHIKWTAESNYKIAAYYKHCFKLFKFRAQYLLKISQKVKCPDYQGSYPDFPDQLIYMHNNGTAQAQCHIHACMSFLALELYLNDVHLVPSVVLRGNELLIKVPMDRST